MSTASPSVLATRRPVVLLAEKLAPSAVALLGDDVEIRHVDGTDRPALLAALADADALLVRSATKVDAEVFGAATRLKVVARAGVGLDNVDVPAATTRGVMVVNAPTSNIVSAAEHAVALLLATARHIPAADASLRSGQLAQTAFEPASVDMASYYWYFDGRKASEELGFVPRDPTDTLFDTVTYLREHFLDGFKGAVSAIEHSAAAPVSAQDAADEAAFESSLPS